MGDHYVKAVGLTAAPAESLFSVEDSSPTAGCQFEQHSAKMAHGEVFGTSAEANDQFCFCEIGIVTPLCPSKGGRESSH